MTDLDCIKSGKPVNAHEFAKYLLSLPDQSLVITKVAGRKNVGYRCEYFDYQSPFPPDDLEELYTIEVKQ